MKNLALFTTVILLLTSLSACDISSTDLGTLTYQRPQAGQSYCIYKITKIIEQPDGMGYAVDDLFCIQCCLNNNPPWPNNAGGSCPSPIDFETQDGAKYRAKIANLTEGSCLTCPQQVTDGYLCP